MVPAAESLPGGVSSWRPLFHAIRWSRRRCSFGAQAEVTGRSPARGQVLVRRAGGV